MHQLYRDGLEISRVECSIGRGKSQVPIAIHDARFSFIWTETLPQLLSGVPPGDAPLGFLADQVAYEQRFQAAVGGEATPGGLGTPWHPTGKHFFWTYYLAGRSPQELAGHRAWKGLVPFRGPAQHRDSFVPFERRNTPKGP